MEVKVHYTRKREHDLVSGFPEGGTGFVRKQFCVLLCSEFERLLSSGDEVGAQFYKMRVMLTYVKELWLECPAVVYNGALLYCS